MKTKRGFTNVPLKRNAMNVCLIIRDKQYGGYLPLSELKKNLNQCFKDIKREVKNLLKLKTTK